MQQGRGFERALIADLGARWDVVRVAHRPDESRSLEAAFATWDAMRAGKAVIAGAVLRDPQLRTFGIGDLLVRNDVLAELCPDAFAGDPLELPVIGLSHGRHYRVVDVKFQTLDILKNGDLTTGAAELDTLTQTWMYNEALGRLQGYTPPAAYIVGRAWKKGDERGDHSWDRLGRIRHDVFLRGRGMDLRELVGLATAWVRRVRTEGAEWRVLPIPSVPELWPNMKAEDAGWHAAKARIAKELADLTLLPRVGTSERARAHSLGITRWDDPRLSAAVLGLNAKEAAILDAVLDVNRDGGAPLRPERLRDGQWRRRAPVEAYVDFEFLQDLADDFAEFPRKGGQALIFQIGCGTYRDGAWRFSWKPRQGYSVVLFGDHGRHWRIDRGAVAAFLKRPHISSIQITFEDDKPPDAHAMPPGGFRLAIVNCWDLAVGRAARDRLAEFFLNPPTRRSP